MSALDPDTPVWAAPMAGGPSTPALVRAVTRAGGVGFLATGYKSPEATRDEIASVRDLPSFGVNLFVPDLDDQRRPRRMDPVAFRDYRQHLLGDAELLGVSLADDQVTDDDSWHQKLDLLRTDPVPIVSFTFGLPSAADVKQLRDQGTTTLVTVTTVGEARAAQDVGVDGLVVQGPRAGGHSATFDPSRSPGDEPTADVLRRVCAEVDLPCLVTGGVAGPGDVKSLLTEGARGVAVGTLLLLSDEAGTSGVHRDALRRPGAATVITRAFTGRPARALRNGFTDTHGAQAPVGYPAIHHLTRDLRVAASRAGDGDRVHLWAGTGHRSAMPGPAGDVIASLTAA